MERKMYEMMPIVAFDSTHCFYIAITNCMNSDELRANWRLIRDDFMLNYQNEITDEFSRWNFYIFYVVEKLDELDGDLRYQIEHDMVSSRKILVDANTISGHEDSFDVLLKKYIVYDVNLGHHGGKEQASFEKDASVVKLLRGHNHED